MRPDLLVDAFGRIRDGVHVAVADLDLDALHRQIAAEANPIAWLIWHLTRLQDDHIAGVADQEQAWTSQGWARRFDTPYPDSAVGYGQSAAEVASLRVPSASLLTDYHDAVHAQTVEYVSTLKDDDLDRIVDTRWDPPVTLAVRLVSVLSDTLQHVGQAGYVRGIILRG